MVFALDKYILTGAHPPHHHHPHSLLLIMHTLKSHQSAQGTYTLPLSRTHTHTHTLMLVFISALTAGVRTASQFNAGLISQVETLLIDIRYNYITRYAYPHASYYCNFLYSALREPCWSSGRRLAFLLPAKY